MILTKAISCFENIECFSTSKQQEEEELCRNQCLPDHIQFSQHYDLGCKHQSEGNYHLAVQCFQQSLQIDALSTKVNFNLGEIFLNEYRAMEEAIKYFTQVIRVDPKHHDAHFNLGFIHFQKNNLSAALRHFREASILRDNDVASWTNVGLVLQELGDTTGAIQANLKAISADSKFEAAYYNLGNLYYEIGKYDEAIAVFLKVLQLNPRHIDAAFNLGVAYQEKGDKGKALKSYETSLKINPSLVEAEVAIIEIKSFLPSK
mmetsp:Transcript_39766/g.51284  ORF Transcript_39766/g.51284 Transcript_39766/m.51284 type:complete len:261 (-) Transcript_39766:73-855(-)